MARARPPWSARREAVPALLVVPARGALGVPTVTARRTLVVPSAAALLVALDALVVTTALPALGADLGTDVAGLGWTVHAYNLTCATGVVGAAALGDRFGRRRVFTCGLSLLAAAAAAAALAPSLP